MIHKFGEMGRETLAAREGFLSHLPPAASLTGEPGSSGIILAPVAAHDAGLLGGRSPVTPSGRWVDRKERGAARVGLTQGPWPLFRTQYQLRLIRRFVSMRLLLTPSL